MQAEERRQEEDRLSALALRKATRQLADVIAFVGPCRLAKLTNREVVATAADVFFTVRGMVKGGIIELEMELQRTQPG